MTFSHQNITAARIKYLALIKSCCIHTLCLTDLHVDVCKQKQM